MENPTLNWKRGFVILKKARWELPGEAVAGLEKEDVSSLREVYTQTISLAVEIC